MKPDVAALGTRGGVGNVQLARPDVTIRAPGMGTDRAWPMAEAGRNQADAGCHASPFPEQSHEAGWHLTFGAEADRLALRRLVKFLTHIRRRVSRRVAAKLSSVGRFSGGSVPYGR